VEQLDGEYLQGDTLMVFKFFCFAFDFYFLKIRTLVLGRNGQKLTDMCGAPFSLAGSFFSWIFHLHPAENSWSHTVGKVSSGTALLSGHLSKCLRYSLSNEETVSNTLQALPNRVANTL
jgi:hypothetical protein